MDEKKKKKEREPEGVRKKCSTDSGPIFFTLVYFSKLQQVTDVAGASTITSFNPFVIHFIFTGGFSSSTEKRIYSYTCSIYIYTEYTSRRKYGNSRCQRI